MFSMRGGGGGIITQTPHGDIRWGNPATDSGIRRRHGRTYHICGVLPQYFEVGGVPSTGMCGKGPQHRSDEGKFYEQAFLLEGRSAAVGEEYASSFQHVGSVHSCGATYQAL